jgi:O-antigen/teichoic acid export membrane protein
MQRKFLLNLILIIFVNLLIKPFYVFGVDRTVQNLTGSESYGLYYALFNLAYIFNIILDAGITNYNNRHISQHTQLLTKYFGHISVIKIVLSLLYIVIVLVWALLFGYSTIEFKFLFILVFGQIFNSYILYNRSNLAGLHLFKTDTFISILDKLIMIGICAPFIFSKTLSAHFSIETFIYAQAFSFLITGVVSFILVKTHTYQPKFKLDLAFLKIILRESYPYALLTLLMAVYSKADTLLLKELLPGGDKEVGVYAAAYRLLEAFNMIAFLFAGILYPIFSKMIKEKENPEQLIKLGVSLLVIPAIIAAIGMSFYRTEIMELLYKDHIDESSKAFGVLMFTFICICNTYIFGTLLTANGNIRLLNKIAGAGVVLNIILNIILIPRMLSLGAAYASLITFGFVTILQTYYSWRYFRLNISALYIGKICLIIILMVSGVYLLRGMDIAWYTQFGLLLFAGLGFSIIFKIINTGTIFGLLKSNHI